MMLVVVPSERIMLLAGGAGGAVDQGARGHAGTLTLSGHGVHAAGRGCARPRTLHVHLVTLHF